MDLDEATISTLKNKETLFEINAAFRKIEQHFHQTHHLLHEELSPISPIKGYGKVSKGQKYKDLPYLVSDIPNHFKKDDFFCCRTMFWWGNELSFSIFLAGKSLEKYQQVLLDFEPDHYFSINSTPWEYHFGDDNYLKSNKLTLEQKKEHLKQHQFLKVAQKLPIAAIDMLPEKALEFYNAFLKKL